MTCGPRRGRGSKRDFEPRPTECLPTSCYRLPLRRIPLSPCGDSLWPSREPRRPRLRRACLSTCPTKKSEPIFTAENTNRPYRMILTSLRATGSFWRSASVNFKRSGSLPRQYEAVSSGLFYSEIVDPFCYSSMGWTVDLHAPDSEKG